MTYVASFAVSLGPIFWLLNAEIYRCRRRRAKRLEDIRAYFQERVDRRAS